MRRPLDQYETPPHYVTALEQVIGSPAGVLYEPCCGSGNIVDMFRGNPKVRRIVTNDIDEDLDADYHLDASLEIPADRFDWIITNPPFSNEQPILEMALGSSANVAFLARLSFLEPTANRSKFWQKYTHRLKHLIVLPRYSFTGAGSDSMTCC